MPELPEVEILVQHLQPLLQTRTIRAVRVHREKTIRPDSIRGLQSKLVGASFQNVSRRAKFLVFSLASARKQNPILLLGHLGMTGRMYLQSTSSPLPKHAAVSLDLGRHVFVFEDTRYFGRLTTHLASLENLGPEPMSDAFTVESFHADLRKSSQAIKVKLLDQKLVVGIGNIYASEALFRAGISPRIMSRRITRKQAQRLHQTIRDVLAEAIAMGSTLPLDFAGSKKRDGLFYYGSSASSGYEERLSVYDREAAPCVNCGAAIRKITQAARSTYFCPDCQKSRV